MMMMVIIEVIIEMVALMMRVMVMTTINKYENKDEHYKCCNLSYKENKIVVFKNLEPSLS